MPLNRFTVRRNDERTEWLDDQAEQHDCSGAWIIREAIMPPETKIPCSVRCAPPTTSTNGLRRSRGPLKALAHETPRQAESGEQRGESDRTGKNPPSGEQGNGRSAHASGRDRDDVRAYLWDELPGSGDRLEARVDAILAMRDRLREHGEAEKADLLGAVDVEAVGSADVASF